MRYRYSVKVLADSTKRDEINRKYSFINKLDGENFIRVGEDKTADFFVIDLDMPATDLERTITEDMRKGFTCRPIIFITISRNQHSCASDKVLQKVPYIKNFCKTSIPCCESIDDLKQALRWFTFFFPKDTAAVDAATEIVQYKIKSSSRGSGGVSSG